MLQGWHILREVRMSVYLIADIEVHDIDVYMEYVRRARPLVEAKGGRYCAQDSEPMGISGGWSPGRMVIIEFSSMKACTDCFSSEAYQRMAPLRERSTTSRAVVVRGQQETHLS